MVRVCHITCDHNRYDTRIFQKECKSLYNNGYDVSLIVADGNGDETVAGVKIFDIGSNKVSRIKRLFQFFKVRRDILNKAVELDCDIYHFHDPELMAVGLPLSKKGKKVIFDMHEDFPQYIGEKDYLPLKGLVAYLYGKIEIYCVKRFAGIITTRQCINDRVEKYNKNIQLITNFPILVDSYEREEPEIPTIVFAGAVDDGWRHKLIINAIDRIDNVKYVLAGLASETYLNELKQLPGWSKVEYLGRISFSKVCELYQHSSIGIAVYNYCKNMGWKEGNLANNKMFEFMNFGLPFICTDYRLWKQIVEEEENCGICVNPDDIDQLEKAIVLLLQNDELRACMGRNGRKAVVDKYNWSSEELLLLSVYYIIEAL